MGAPTGNRISYRGFEQKIWGDICKYEEAREVAMRHILQKTINRRVYPAGQLLAHPINNFRQHPPDALQRGLDLPFNTRPYISLPRLGTFETVEDARKIWEIQPAEWCRDNWTQVMYSLLLSDLGRACMFLQASNFVSAPSWPYISIVVGYVCENVRLLPAEGRKAVAGRLVDAMISVLRERKEKGAHSNAWNIKSGLYNLLEEIGSEQLTQLHQAMDNASLAVSSASRMRIASRLSEDTTKKKLALDIFETALMDSAAETDDPREIKNRTRAAEKILNKILKPVRPDAADSPSSAAETATKNTTGQGQITPDDLWDFSLRTGFTLNQMHITTFIQSLFLSGEDAPFQAWRVFDIFTNHGIPPDRAMQAVLLNGSKNSGDHRYILRALDTIAKSPSGHAHLGKALRNNILHAFFTLSFTQRRIRYDEDVEGRRSRVLWSYPAMVQLYGKLFDMEPLLEMIPPSFETFLSSPAEIHKITAIRGVPRTLQHLLEMDVEGQTCKPTQATLHIMIMSFMLSVQGTMRGGALLAFYGHFRSLLAARHPLALSLVQNNASRVHDSIIKVLGNSVPDARASLEIISDMLYEAGHAGGNDHGHNPRPVHPRPTKWTWNIVLDSWLRLVSQDSAGSVIGLMRKHGVNPNLVTWNTIMMRAASEKNTLLAVRAAQKIRDSGFEPDAITMQAFSMLHDKDEFLQLIQNPPEEDDGVEDVMKEVEGDLERRGPSSTKQEMVEDGRKAAVGVEAASTDRPGS